MREYEVIDLPPFHQNTLIVADRILTPHEVIEHGSIYVQNGVVHRVTDKIPEKVKDVVLLDLDNCLVLPGLIDIHVHGMAGVDIMSAEEDDLMVMQKELARKGTRAFLATTVPAPLPELKRVLAVIARRIKRQKPEDGAALLGIHLEGPFLNPERRGIHRAEYLLPPDKQVFEELQDAAEGNIKLVTLAPELPGALSLIEYLRRRGVQVSVGHSRASYEEFWKSIEAGVEGVTHLFNAMGLFHHRHPGLAGAALEAEVYADLIADRLHLHPAVIRLACRLKKEEKVILISDGLPLTDSPDGRYLLWGREVTKTGTQVTDSNGNLVGSVKSLLEMLLNVSRYLEKPLEQVVSYATLNPARFLGLGDQWGSITPHSIASFTVIKEKS
ncbi:N-acetylglucosamine-6-phosphate deacetylase [Calderihabitans maritimus]|uniref:N-acetylglucosamine-6-phosphate deacetylase n=1 Tax=Calderihabitans maritimus TaxID=1246530 RepID=UPI001863CB19|nr:N-acetylglucosamine-6-phosphate deacetylase [Calderihabitans maritimus]